MKKIIIAVLCMILMVNAFALKLPNGDNVKTEDVVMDGDSIVEVKLKEDTKITTPLNGQQLIANSEEPVKFYKSGALKSFKVGRDYFDYEHQSIKIDDQEVKIYRNIEFYESGALKSINLASNSTFKMNIEGSPVEAYSYLSFYDSGNPNEFKVYTGYLKEDIEVDIQGNKFSITNSIYDEYQRTPSYFPFSLYENGKLKNSVLSKETTIKTSIGELFAGKGGISFWEDGSVKSFINDDTIVDTIAGMKVSIPSGTEMSIYKNGKIRSFQLNRKIRFKFKVGANTYTTIEDNWNTNFLFVISEDGNIISTPLVSWDNNNDKPFAREMHIVSFDSKLEPRIIIYRHRKRYVVYNRKAVAEINSDKAEIGDNVYVYYQPGDTGEDIWMVYFDDKGIPSTYSVYDKITGERNTEKKQFVRKK